MKRRHKMPEKEEEPRRFGSLRKFTGGFHPRTSSLPKVSGSEVRGRAIPAVQERTKPPHRNGVQR